MAPDAARLVLLLALAAALTGQSQGAWCLCRRDHPDPDTTLQKTLNYACGRGADCKPILKNGACFAPDTVKAHCSYAVNSFYQRSGQNPQACVFSGTTMLSPNDPSFNSCQYPANASAALTGVAVDIRPGAMGQGPSGSLNDNNSGADILHVAGTAKVPVLLPEAPQAQVFHLDPKSASAVASSSAVDSTLVLASILFLVLIA